MSGSCGETELLLPARTRLLHIGPMKTGTTAVQAAASGRRKQLLAHGVRYPGRSFNQVRQIGGLIGWSVDVWRRTGRLGPDLLDVEASGVPDRRLWNELRAEIDADTQRRVFITHEFVSQVDDTTAARIVEAVGEPVHICITVRAPARIVPSLWAQGMRDDAQTEPFEDWLRRFFGRDVEQPASGRFQRAYDHGDLVQRWARLVGSQNVTVIVVDPSQPTLMTGAFEQMLGLPDGMLQWRTSNRALTAVEAELFRTANAELRDRGADWRTFFELVRKGAVRLGPERREVGPDERRVTLPPWAAEIVTADGQRFARAIRQSGVRVVGDLDTLAVAPETAEWHDIEQIPVAIAANALAGAVLAGQLQRDKFQAQLNSASARVAKLHAELMTERSKTLNEFAATIPSSQRADEVAAAFTSHELAAALKHRLLVRLRHGRTHSVPGRPPFRHTRNT
ncbi:hypothetical protein [Microlunatus endophyticus]|uniref:hypothetical protein n=1 Tax=Microlunatus endophyticus TaxID=1716077 RepID=UPI0016646D1D|nr:hypothetical protein [Microlunatus endophyticus]